MKALKDGLLSEEKFRLLCKLTRPELRKRKETLISKLKKELIDKRELENGFSYLFVGAGETLDLLSEFVKVEILSGAFFTFNFLMNDNGLISLELTGPEGVKEFIQKEIQL